MNSLDKIGGIPLIMKKLLDNNLIHGNVLTVTGKTIKENIKQYKISTAEQQIVREVENPLHNVGTAVILQGNLAPEGAVIKTAGVEMTKFTGKARVFDGEESAFDAVANGEIDVVAVLKTGLADGLKILAAAPTFEPINHGRLAGAFRVVGWINAWNANQGLGDVCCGRGHRVVQSNETPDTNSPAAQSG